MIIIGTPHSWIKKIVIEKKIAKDAILIDINGLTANADKKYYSYSHFKLNLV